MKSIRNNTVQRRRTLTLILSLTFTLLVGSCTSGQYDKTEDNMGGSSVDKSNNKTISPNPEPFSEDSAKVIQSIEDPSKVIQSIIDNMVTVRGGTFQMGCTSKDSDCNGDEPVSTVTLSSYKISKYEVTQEQWRAIMIDKPIYIKSYFKCDKCPAETVSWKDAQKFLKKINNMTGKKFRLPTEAEWEFAARGGRKSKGYKYAGSNTLNEIAWYDKNSDNKTHPVGQKKSNELGLYDMGGNVWEWCSEWYGETEYYRVLRGGSWEYKAAGCRLPYRHFNEPIYRYYDTGFRLVSGL